MGNDDQCGKKISAREREQAAAPNHGELHIQQDRSNQIGEEQGRVYDRDEGIRTRQLSMQERKGKEEYDEQSSGYRQGKTPLFSGWRH